MAKNKVKLGIEIVLMVAILGMIYKLATRDDVKEGVQNGVVEQALSSGDLSEQAIAGSAAPAIPSSNFRQKDAERVAKEIMKQAQTPAQRGDFDKLN